MAIVLEGQPKDIHRGRWNQVATERKRQPACRQLLLDALARRAIGVVSRRFDDNAGRVPVGGLRNLEVNVAIARIQINILQVRLRDVEELQLPAHAVGNVARGSVLRPSQDVGNADLLRRLAGQGHVFRRVAIVAGGILRRRAMAYVVRPGRGGRARAATGPIHRSGIAAARRERHQHSRQQGE